MLIESVRRGCAWALLVASVSMSACLAEDVKMPNAWTPALMMQVKRIGNVQVSPDGKRAVYTVRQGVMEPEVSEYRTQIHLANLSDGSTRELTQGDKSCDEPQWSPDGAWIAFVSNRVGKKNVWLIRPDGGEAVQLTESKSDVINFKWSPDGKSLAFLAPMPASEADEQKTKDKNDARVVDEEIKLNRLAVVSVAATPTLQREPRYLTPETLNVASDSNRTGRGMYDWSPDGKSIAFTHSRSPQADQWTTADLSLVEVATATIRPLLSSPAVEASPLFSPDGKWIACTVSDDPPKWGGFRTVQIISASGGTAKKLAETQDSFGRYSELVGWTADGQSLYFTEAQGTNLRLLSLPLEGKPSEISHHAGMSSSGVSVNAKRTHFGFGWETLDQPSEAFVSPVKEFKPVAVSKVHHDLPRPPLGATEAIRWKSTDGQEIEGLLTFPVGYEKGKRYPLMLVIHGGPMGVFMQTFDGSATNYPVAAFASRGYAILRANVRGSSGYGRKFRSANYGDWGGGDFRDLMSGVDHVIAQGVADPDRLGVMGWSYGGFMTSWTITQTKRFRAASVGAGVTNLVSFTGTADIPGFLPDYFSGEFWDKLDAYRAHSAMFQIKGVTTPTLIQHGERDERVPLSQGQELYNALKRQGCVTKMVVYPRTPHGIEEPRLMLDCMERNLEWFDLHVRGVKS